MKIQNKPTEISKNRDDKRGRFSQCAEILGVVADSLGLLAPVFSFVFSSLGITSILVASKAEESVKILFTEMDFTPWHSLSLWLISVYAFLGFSRREWTKNKHRRSYSHSFLLFVLKDLLFGWKNISYSVSLILFCLLLIWNINSLYTSSESLANNFRGIFLFFAIFGLPVMIFVAFLRWLGHADLSAHDQNVKRFSRDVMEDEGKWEQLILDRITGFQWLSASQFHDVMLYYGIGVHQVEILMAKYAFENSSHIRYANVFNAETKQAVTATKVLINLKALDKKKYFWA